MPFENWDMVHYVIVNDVIVSLRFVIQSHPSLQSALYMRRFLSESGPRLKTEQHTRPCFFVVLFRSEIHTHRT